MNDKGKSADSKEAGIPVTDAISRERQLEIIFNASNDIIFLISIEAGPRYRFASVNQAFMLATGLQRKQIEGRYVDEIIPEPSLTLVLAKYDEAVADSQAMQWEETSDYPAGRKTGIVNITPVLNDKGECTMLVGTVHDITERKKAEKIIEESEFKYRMVVENELLGVAWASADGRVLSVNPAFCKMLGYDVDELLGVYFGDFTHPDDTAKEEELMIQMMNGGIDNYRIEKRYKTKKEIYIWVELNLTCYRNAIDKSIEFFIGIIQDLTDRKKASEQLLKEKELSESIINSLPGIFYLQEITGEFIRWNKQFEVVTGYTTEEVTRLHPLDFFDENDKEIILKKSMDIYINGAADLEATIITKSGNKIPHYFTGQLIEYEGRPCIIGTGIDITERKKVSEQLLKEKELSESIINSLPGIFYLFDNTGKYLRWNKNHETVPGYTTEEMQAMYPLDFFDEDEKELIKERIEKVFTEGYADAEANFMGKSGKKNPYYFNGIAIEYEGKPCLMGVAFDVTERKIFEQELRDAEIKFRTLVEKSQVGVYIVQKGKFTYVNPRFAEIFGYSVNELIDADPVKTVISEEYQAIAKENVRARLEGEIDTVHYEATGKKKNGSLNRVEFYGSRTLYGGQPTIIGTMIDITERKLAEEALQKSEANLHTIFDTTDTIYTLLDNNFQVMSFNYRASDFIEKELNQELKLSMNIISYFPKARQPELYVKMRQVLSGENISYESSYLQKDGSVNWYYVRMFPIRNSEGKIFGMMLAVSDITEKKLLEQKIMNQKVQEQKKITRAVLNAQEKERNKIGQELHDNVNQILVGSKMYLGLIDKKATGKTNLVKQSMGLIDNAINEIRSLTREQVTPQRKIDLKDLIQSLVDNVNEHTSMKTSFDFDIDIFVLTDDLKLNIYRIIQEGINNILKHSEAKNVAILVRAADEGLHIIISDDGKGFDTELKKKGIGIANMLNRVESYNGDIVVDGNPGKGCRIEITFPV